MSDATTLILRGIEPLPDWPSILNKTNTEAIYSVLIGAAASLLQSERLMDSFSKQPEISAKKPYNSATLYDELQEMSKGPGPMLAWDHDPNLLNWSVGYFLNRAQHNIAAAFDKGVAAWTAHGVNMPFGDRFNEDMWMGSWMLTRLYLLRQLASVPIDSIDDLIVAFHDKNLGDTDEAAQELDRQIRRVGQVSNLTRAMALIRPQLNRESCLAIVCARTNSFKHRIFGKDWTEDKKLGRRQRLVTELAVTIWAYDCVSRFWRGMVRAMVIGGKQRPKKKPRR